MKLTLENFRCYLNRTFDLPENGITLLWGDSGKGKTSIFKAIQFALYGVKGKEQTTTFGYKKSKVTLELNDIIITRTRTPNHLSVKTPTFLAEDIVAQKWINEQFGNWFHYTSYLSQKCLDNFFTLTRDSRAEILRYLSIQSFDIDRLKNKNKEDIKGRKQLLQTINNEWKWIKQEIDQRKLSTVEEPVFPLKIATVSDVEQAIQEEQKQQEHNWKKLTQAQNRLKIVNDQLRKSIELNANHLAYQEQFHSYEQEVAKITEKISQFHLDLPAEISKLKQHIQQLEFLQQYHEKQSKLNEIKQQQLAKYEAEKQRIETLLSSITFSQEDHEAIEGEIQFLEGLKRAVQEISDIWNKLALMCNQQTLPLDQFKSYCMKACEFSWWKEIPSLESMEKQVAELMSKKGELTAKRSDLKNQMSFSSYKCPECSTNLAIVNSCVIRHHPEAIQQQYKVISTELTQISETLSTLNTKLIEYRNMKALHTQLVTIIKRHDDYLDENGHTVDADLKQSRIDLKASSNAREQQRNLQQQLRQLSPEDKVVTSMLEADIQKLHAKITIMSEEEDDDIDYHKQTLSIYEQQRTQQEQFMQQKSKLDEKMKELQQKLSLASSAGETIQKYQEEVESLDQEIQTRRDKAERFDKRKVAIEKWNQERERYQEAKRLHTKCEEAKKRMDIAERSLSVALQMNKIITEAESNALQSFLRLLNEECERHMQVMFDGELSLLVKYEHSEDETKKLFVDVQLIRGTEEVSYDSLSGGESDRCALVLFLAFNKLAKAKILLLDECLSSLHAESVEDIVEHIKTEFPDKICIMTLHQTTKGIFDQIIHV